MAEETKTTKTADKHPSTHRTSTVKETNVKKEVVQRSSGAPRRRGERTQGSRRFSGRRNNRRRNVRNEAPEYEQKILDIARVTRVTAGGRRFNFRITMVIGNRNGKVGVATGRGKDVAIAIDKAARNAKKVLFTVPMTPQGTLPYSTNGKHSSARVMLQPSRTGRGIIAGGPVRVVCELAGYKDLSAKIIGRTTNKLNNARATVVALKAIHYQSSHTADKEQPKAAQDKPPARTVKQKDDDTTKEKAKPAKRPRTRATSTSKAKTVKKDTAK